MRYPAINRYFTLACFTLPPLLGSAVSIIWHGGALWCLFKIATGSVRLSRDRAMWQLTALLYVYVIAALISFSINPNGNMDNVLKLLPLLTLLLFPFSYSVWTISDKKQIAEAAALGSAIACFGAFILALVQHFIFNVRPEGGAGNSLIFATVASLAGLVALASSLHQTERYQGLMLSAYGAALVAVILSGSRSIWISMALASLFIGAVGFKQLKRLAQNHAKKIILATLMIVILTSGILLTRMEVMLANFQSITENANYNNSVGLRFAMWKTGFNQFLENPVLGIGLQNTGSAITQGLQQQVGRSLFFTHFHNGFLTILVASGSIALAAIIGIFCLTTVFVFRSLKSQAQPEQKFGGLILLCFIITYAVGGSFNIILGHDIIDTIFIIFLIVGTYLAVGTSQPDMEPEQIV